MMIRMVDIAPGANTADEGSRLFEILHRALRTPGTVTISFDGIQTATQRKCSLLQRPCNGMQTLPRNLRVAFC